jgi:hypothetical protein
MRLALSVLIVVLILRCVDLSSIRQTVEAFERVSAYFEANR